MLNTCECCRILNGKEIGAVRECSPEIKVDVSADRWVGNNVPYDECPNCSVPWRHVYYTIRKLIKDKEVKGFKRYFNDGHRNRKGHQDLMLKIGLVEKYPTLHQFAHNSSFVTEEEKHE